MRPTIGPKHRSVMPALSVLLAVTVLLVITAVGCSDIPGTETTAGGGTTTAGSATTLVGDTTTVGATTTTLATTTSAPTTTALPSATTTTEALSSAEEVLPGGHIKGLGYIEDVWLEGSERYLSIDYVEIISGEAEATAAAIEDGLIASGETWDAEFYVNNDNPLLRTFPISDSVEIYTQYRGMLVDLDGAPCTWADFYGFWNAGPLPEGDSHLPTSLWWIERDGPVVVWTMQMFLP